MSLKEEKGLPANIDMPPRICLTRLREGGENMKGLQKIAKILVIIGAINWGLIGFFGFNLVTAIFSSMTGLESIVYMLVGLSGVLMLFNWKK